MIPFPMMSKSCLLLFTALTLYSCAPPSIWEIEEEQPSGLADQTSFGKKIIGTYQSIEDGKTFYVQPNRIIKENKVTFILKKSTINSYKRFKLFGDSLYDNGRKMFRETKMIGDSILINESYFDTLFSISPDQILRKDRNYYFLNFKVREADFRVKLLFVDENNYLQLSKPQTQRELDILKPATDLEPKFVPEGLGKMETFMFSLKNLDTLSYVKGPGFKKIDRFIKISDRWVPTN